MPLITGEQKDTLDDISIEMFLKPFDELELIDQKEVLKEADYLTKKYLNKGGMVGINRMTAPLGYALGGPAGMTQDEFIKARMIQEDEPRDLSKLSKFDQFISDRFSVDPRFTAKEKIKDFGRGVRDKAKTGIETLKKLGSGAMGIGQELFGAGPAEADINEPLGDPQYVQSMIDFLRGAINAEKYPPFGGGRDFKKIKVLEIKLGMYERLQASQGN